jgi:hypothetical protein
MKFSLIRTLCIVAHDSDTGSIHYCISGTERFTAETQRTLRLRRELILSLRHLCALCVSAVNSL